MISIIDKLKPIINSRMEGIDKIKYGLSSINASKVITRVPLVSSIDINEVTSSILVALRLKA